MKKFTAILAALAFGSAAAMAAQSTPAGLLGPVKYEMTPKAQRFMQETTQRAIKGQLAADDQMLTRSWTDTRTGLVYDLSILLTSEYICDLVSFGDNVTYGFDEIPYYAANFILSARKQDQTQLDTYITWMACWPSYYVYEQAFTFPADQLVNGVIPVDKRDYEAVSMTQLANDPTFTQRFQEVDYIGSQQIPGTKKWNSFTLLENAMSAADGTCVVNGNQCMTSITKSGSADNPTYMSTTFDFQAFNHETTELDCKTVVYYQNMETARNGILRLAYVGGARVEGFEPITVTLPEFGDVHLFNAGEWSSEGFGDTNPFTGAWGPFTALYIATGDSHLLWKIDETAKEFNPDIIENMGVDVGADELDKYASNLTGYLFTDVKYARDTNLNPAGDFIKCEFPIEFDEGNRVTTISIVPVLNSFVPSGYNYDSWSNDYGVLAYVNNFPEMPIAGSMMAWGTTEGFRASITNSFKKTAEIVSTGDIIYHYNPNDMAQVRKYSSIGDVNYASSVSGVMIDTAIITAGNGTINVKPGVAAPVAVYNLQGLCILNTNVAAGETVNVSAPKGVYIVTVDGKSTKIAL